VSELVERLGARDVSFFDHPTLARLAGTSSFLELLCAVGVLACALLFLGVLPRTALLVAWASYLSLVNAGFPFTAFQWDLLLVEVLLASALFVVPARIDRFDARVGPSAAGRWLVWLVVFRLMLRSGAVKLASGDPTWADLSALEYHYFTQPLPTVFGWYAHQLPPWVHVASCAVMFGIELVLPFFVFLPSRWARRTAAAGFIGLMLLILVTGNYGFFNLLTIVLAMSLVDDDAWRRVLPARLLAVIERARARTTPTGEVAPPERPEKLGARVRASLAVLLAALGMLGFVAGLLRFESDPLSPIRPFRSVNDYGLFAVMTVDRPEIEIEGSMDGVAWTPYLFRYKAGPLDRAPVWNTPHQPRLDWQMWFAALGSPRENPWLVRLVQRLLENEPRVLALLAKNPFPGAPPRYVRATLYDYQFTTMAEHAETGAWWKREERRAYVPAISRTPE
jgi:hypothetical protein